LFATRPMLRNTFPRNMQLDSSPGGDTDAASRKQARLFWMAGFLGWCALVTLTASSLFVFGLFPFQFALKLALGFWGFYALAAPIVVRFARFCPLNGTAWRRNIALHIVGTILFVLACEGGFDGVMYLLEPEMQAILTERAQQTGVPLKQPGLAHAPGPFGGELEAVFPKPSIRLVVFKSQFSLPLYWVLVGVAHALGAMSALREREKQAAQLAAHLTQAQLSGLRTQLQPHFLFNTLNSIAALIPQNARLATEMVMNLSDLLRMTLREPQRGEILLSEELKLLQHYVDIQRLRFGERLVFHVEATDDALNAFVPPLLLQPLVENAIRHGLEASDQTECITVRGRAKNQELVLEVANTFTAASDENLTSTKSTGLGLANTQARLKVQYGDHQRFQALPLADGGFQVTMRIPFRANLTPSLATTHEN
jgi:two-component system, LytTR family, sensor kinase